MTSRIAWWAACAALAASPAWAQLEIPDVVFPTVPAAAAAPHDFVPPGWVVDKEGRTDLDRDGRDDVFLVLRMTDPRNVIANPDGLGQDPFDTNPRMLVVGVGQDGGGYRRHTVDHALIPRPEQPTADDPLSDAVAARGVLKVTVGFWTSAGSWYMSRVAYTLRIESGCLRLIGYDRNDTHRGSGEITETSVNYLTGKVKESAGTMDDDALRETWRELKGPRQVCIDAIGDGLEFRPD